MKTQQLNWLHIGKYIAGRLCRSYPWIEFDELMSVGIMAAWQADQKYVKHHSESSRLAWACWKGRLLAIDELRRTHGAIRTGGEKPPFVFQGSAMLERFKDGIVKPISFAAHSCVGVPQEHYVGTSCREWLRGLSARDQEIVRLRFDEDLTMRAVGERVGLSEPRVSQIMKLALSNLREWRAEEYEAGERSRPSLQ